MVGWKYVVRMIVVSKYFDSFVMVTVAPCWVRNRCLDLLGWENKPPTPELLQQTLVTLVEEWFLWIGYSVNGRLPWHDKICVLFWRWMDDFFLIIICEFGEKLRYEIEVLETMIIFPDMAVSILKS